MELELELELELVSDWLCRLQWHEMALNHKLSAKRTLGQMSHKYLSHIYMYIWNIHLNICFLMAHRRGRGRVRGGQCVIIKSWPKAISSQNANGKTFVPLLLRPQFGWFSFWALWSFLQNFPSTFPHSLNWWDFFAFICAQSQAVSHLCSHFYLKCHQSTSDMSLSSAHIA